VINCVPATTYALWATVVIIKLDVILSTWFQWVVYRAYKFMKATYSNGNGQVTPEQQA
jgi:hypothetical protein